MAAWDVVVIGGGAAGLSAAAAAAEVGLSCLVLDRMGGGGELMNLGPLQEVDGAPAGPEVAAGLLDAAIAAGAELGVAEVTGLAAAGGQWRVDTDDGTQDARAVILATGLAPGTLGIGGEADFEGRGLSHCAACDGPLYGGQPVVVAGTDRWAVAEAQALADVASEVTLVTQGGAAPVAGERVGVVRGRIAALEGADGLEAVLVQPDDGGAAVRLATRAVFVQAARRPALGFAPVLACDADGRLVTGSAQRCSLPGLFAAGDVHAGASRTVAGAMAEGRLAALAARDLLSALGKAAG